MNGKVAVITAGGSGMGAAAARKLAETGYNIAVLSSSGKGEALAAEYNGLGVTGSNQSNEDIKKLIDGAYQKWGRIDVLVNSAGHGPRGDLLDFSDDDWHRGMDVYLMNVVRAVRLVTPVMQAQKKARLSIFLHLRHLNLIRPFRFPVFFELDWHHIPSFMRTNMLPRIFA